MLTSTIMVLLAIVAVVIYNRHEKKKTGQAYENGLPSIVVVFVFILSLVLAAVLGRIIPKETVVKNIDLAPFSNPDPDQDGKIYLKYDDEGGSPFVLYQTLDLRQHPLWVSEDVSIMYGGERPPHLEIMCIQSSAYLWTLVNKECDYTFFIPNGSLDVR